MEAQLQVPQAAAKVTCAHECCTRLCTQSQFGLHSGFAVLLSRDLAFCPITQLLPNMQPRKQSLSAASLQCAGLDLCPGPGRRPSQPDADELAMLQAEAGLQEWDAVDPMDEALEEPHQPHHSETASQAHPEKAFCFSRGEMQCLLLPWHVPSSTGTGEV